MEAKKKISESLKGHLVSEETRRKISEANKGKPVPEERKKRISETEKGRISPMKGRKHSEESKKKASSHIPWNKLPEEVRNDRIKEWRRSTHYKSAYGLTLEQVDEMLIKQDHKCALCGKSLKETKRNIDHNHITKKVRGILCHRCNIGLGYVEDEEFLKSSLIYLKGGDL
jgi:hypothetical protein